MHGHAPVPPNGQLPPNHCKISIPYSQALRLRRMCSEEQHLQKWTRELKKHLIKRRYRELQLSNEIHRVLAISRENCLQSRPNQDKSARIPLVVTYYPILQNVQSITWCHLSTLHTSERLREAFPRPLLIALRRPKNLRGFLVRATLTATNQELRGSRPCGAILDVRRAQYWRPRINSPAIQLAWCIKWILLHPVSPPILFI